MNARRSALLVATDRYADDALRGLLAPSKDAHVLAELLRDRAVGGFDVRVLRDAAAQDIRIGVEDFFADREPDDMLLLHFSCHGLKNADGELFLAATDTRPARLASTAVAADFVSRQMTASRARRVVLLLDCCYGGAFPRGMVVRASSDAAVRAAFEPPAPIGAKRGRAIVTASSAVQYAFEGGDLAAGSDVNPSVFTAAIVDALITGDADRDGDGWVSLTELFTYVRDAVRERTPHQTPQMWTFGAEGDLLIARSRRRRISPSALPPELVEALTSALPFTRLGLIAELRERVSGTDLGQALTAYQTLQILAGDDSRRVGDAAAAAIDEAALSVSPTALDMRVSRSGQATPRADLVISGSPLATTVSVTASEPWIDIEQDGSTIHVSANRRETGDHRCVVVISGPTGELSVPVRMTVGSSPARPHRSPSAETEVRSKGRGLLIWPSALRRVLKTTLTDDGQADDMSATAVVDSRRAPAYVDGKPETHAPSRGWQTRYSRWLAGSATGICGIGLLTTSGSNFGSSFLLDSDHFHVAPSFWDGFQLAALIAILAAILIALYPRLSPLGAGLALGTGLFTAVLGISAINGNLGNYTTAQTSAWYRMRNRSCPRPWHRRSYSASAASTTGRRRPAPHCRCDGWVACY